MDLEKYWDTFYDVDHSDLEQPTSFALYASARIRPGSTIFEIGCGNGRDAVYFARIGMRVIASDASEVAVSHAGARSERVAPTFKPRFINVPMESLDDGEAGQLDVVYMRFVLHAVPADVASRALSWASRNLRSGGRIFIEARSVLGSLYGVGTPAGRDAFFQDGHFRRFIRVDELVRELRELGFKIDDVCEEAHLAVHGDDDPVVVRVMATIDIPGKSGAEG